MNTRLNLYETLHSKIVSSLIFFIILISYCYIDFLKPFDKVLHGAAYFITFLYAFLYLIQRKFTPYSIALFIFFIVGFIASIFGQYADIESYLHIYLKILGFSLYLEHGLMWYNKNTISSLYYVLWILVFINFATICMFPNGMYVSTRYSNNWFFMYDNTHIMWYFSAILTSYIYNHSFNKKVSISTCVLYGMITYCILYCKSANSLIAYSIFIIYLLLNRLIVKIKAFNYKTYLKAFSVFNILFVFARIQNAFEWFIVDVLGKKLSFSGRTIIWDRTIELISKSPIIGYGYEPPIIFVSKMNNIFYSHAHNTLLDICYKGGIVLTIAFMYILFILHKSIKECMDKKITNFVSIILFCCLIMMIFEARQEKIGLYIILTIASCINIYKGSTNNG